MNEPSLQHHLAASHDSAIKLMTGTEAFHMRLSMDVSC